MVKRKLKLSIRYISAQDYYNIFNKLAGPDLGRPEQGAVLLGAPFTLECLM